jgi:PKHD-type hydroxylase
MSAVTPLDLDPTPVFNHGLGAFTEAELDELERYCDTLPLMKAALAGHDADEQYDFVRTSRMSSIRQTPEIEWFYKKLIGVCNSLNRDYRFDLRDFSEAPIYMVYHGSENAHFDWHIDTGLHIRPPRKLSMTLQLTDPSQYEGGELEFNAGSIIVAPKDRGAVIAFPSHTVHRVAPVTAGTRKSVVAWITGPSFR